MPNVRPVDMSTTHRSKLTQASPPARLASQADLIKSCVWSMTCAFAARYERAEIFSRPDQSTRCCCPGTCRSFDQTFLGCILVPICCEVLGPELLVQSQSPILQPTSRMVFCFFAAPQWDFMLRAADRGPLQATPGRAKPRRLTSEQRCRREMRPAL